MKIQFEKNYFVWFVILLIVESVIAIFLSEGFIRSNFGDFLVVILIYSFVKSFLDRKPIYVAIGVLIFAYVIEFLQLFNLLELLHLQRNKIVKTILGSTFQFNDLVAYTLGIGTILILEYTFKKGKCNSN